MMHCGLLVVAELGVQQKELEVLEWSSLVQTRMVMHE